MAQTGTWHWLDQYGSPQYRWQARQIADNRTRYYRPLGLVEYFFDSDGRYCKGCADLNVELTVRFQTSLLKKELRQRILLAWACLRCEHMLLQSKAIRSRDLDLNNVHPTMDVQFVVDAPKSLGQALEDAGEHLVFLEDYFETVDARNFWSHCQNTARILDPAKALSKIFVLPLDLKGAGDGQLKFLTIASHQIMDGLTCLVWERNFVHLFNLSAKDLEKRIEVAISPAMILQRLPLPQEALYPPIPGNRARQRWYWLLTRILRHVRKPLPAGFSNPLVRSQPRKEAVAFSPTYVPVLDYTEPPLLNALQLSANVGFGITERLHRLCWEAKASIGAGCFALVGLIMMEMHERREPEIPLDRRRPFIASFPLDPRAFFNHRVEPDSLMLAFSDGIALPFLPSSLDLEGRIRLLARQAHRQLIAFQKRPNDKHGVSPLHFMGSRGAGRLLAMQYAMQMERIGAKIPSFPQSHQLNIQGAYPMKPNDSPSTCGVSSIGKRDTIIGKGMYDLNKSSGKDVVADYENFRACVRPRDGEFLVGCAGDEEGLSVDVSIDGNAMDPILVEHWRRRFETVLQEVQPASCARL